VCCAWADGGDGKRGKKWDVQQGLGGGLVINEGDKGGLAVVFTGGGLMKTSRKGGGSCDKGERIAGHDTE